MGTYHAEGHSHEHDHSHENMAPTVPLLLSGGLVLLTIIGVFFQQLVVNPGAEPRPMPELIGERQLQFTDHDDGSVTVRELPGGQVLDTVGPGEGNFLRGTLRGLVRERRLHDESMVPGFVIGRYADGSIVLSDTATGRRIDLRAFGEVNAREFTRYLPAAAGGEGLGEDATTVATVEE